MTIAHVRPSRLAPALCVLVAVVAVQAASGQAQTKRPAQARHESVPRTDGDPIYGKVTGDAKTGFTFTPIKDGKPFPLREAGTVEFDGPSADAMRGYPPMRVILGLEQQVSGKLGTVDDQVVRLEDGPSGKPVVTLRGGAVALSQRPGEALVYQDGFESLDQAHWAQVGEPSIVAEPHLVGSRSLALPAGGSAVTYRLNEPVGSGRLELAFHDPGTSSPGLQWFIDLLFRGPDGDQSVRVVIDWGEESLAVLSSGKHSLAVQRLARQAGWHRLEARFGPRTEIAIDGLELAHGRGTDGPLVEIRLANRVSGDRPAPPGSLVHFDDFRLLRLAEPVGGQEVTPQTDDVRLVDGDQLFGKVKSADADHVQMRVDQSDVSLPWTDVASMAFRRAPESGEPIEGLLVRLEWRSAPGNDPRDLDQVEGVLTRVSEEAFTLGTPFCGELTIPRERLRRLKVLGEGRRVVLDSTAHHLGNADTSKDPRPLDPPLPEGGSLERVFKLDRVPDGDSAWLVLDVVEVVGEALSLPFSGQVKKGELRTNAQLNGQQFDYLNRHITTRNQTPERIRLPIPAGLLKAGENKLKLQQVGTKEEPEEFDDLGILTIAIEFEKPGSSKP